MRRASHWQLLATVSQGQPHAPNLNSGTKWDLEVQTSAVLQSSGQQGKWPWSTPFSDEHELGLCPLRIQLHPLALASLPGPHRPPKHCCPPGTHWEQTREPDMRHPLDLPSAPSLESQTKHFLLLRSLQTLSGPPPGGPPPCKPWSHQPQAAHKGNHSEPQIRLPHAARTIHTWSLGAPRASG